MVSQCRVCGRDDNRIQIRSGTGLCCNICEKIEKRDIDLQVALDYLWSINTQQSAKLFYDLEEIWNAAPQPQAAAKNN